jgi:xanthine/uracil permease
MTNFLTGVIVACLFFIIFNFIFTKIVKWFKNILVDTIIIYLNERLKKVVITDNYNNKIKFVLENKNENIGEHRND